VLLTIQNPHLRITRADHGHGVHGCFETLLVQQRYVHHHQVVLSRPPSRPGFKRTHSINSDLDSNEWRDIRLHDRSGIGVDATGPHSVWG